MAKRGKLYVKARELRTKPEYNLEEAVKLLKQGHYAKFDESVDVAMRLGVNPKQSDQMVRGTIVLPHGIGKSKKICVLATGEKVKEAEAAGADFAGGEELIEKIAGGWIDFDVVIATPDIMRGVGKLGRILGTKGLMPNPKSGTVTFDIKKAVEETKAGKVEFRVDKTSIIHSTVGKASFDEGKLVDNVRVFLQAVQHARPAAAKGKYIRSMFLSTTMGPSFKIADDVLEK
ncbi:MAG: 50S ribosomal protein L1 [Candidatus Aminicenantales bacterium]